uniref:Bravo_FIGEY domain-containing protein n=1 Tax=Anisakis simplex TaxID=6269 RepID=A0A0M3KBZ3_ANISI
LSGRASPMYDYDGDILEEDPRYKKMAPPKPVIHRWSSTEWENFEEDSKSRSLTSASKDGENSHFRGFQASLRTYDRIKIFPFYALIPNDHPLRLIC